MTVDFDPQKPVGTPARLLCNSCVNLRKSGKVNYSWCDLHRPEFQTTRSCPEYRRRES